MRQLSTKLSFFTVAKRDWSTCRFSEYDFPHFHIHEVEVVYNHFRDWNHKVKLMTKDESEAYKRVSRYLRHFVPYGRTYDFQASY